MNIELLQQVEKRLQELRVPCSPEIYTIVDALILEKGTILEVKDLPNNQIAIEILRPPSHNTNHGTTE